MENNPILGFCPNTPEARRVEGDIGFLYTDATTKSFADAVSTCEAQGGFIPNVKDTLTLLHGLDLISDMHSK